MASGVNLRENPELQSIRQFVVVLNPILATPATSLVLNCNGPAVPLDPSPTWRCGEGRGGGCAAWAAACPPHNAAQTYIHSFTYTYLKSWRGHSSFAIRVDITRGATIPAIRHLSIAVELGARGCSQRWERSSDLTGQLSPASSWAPPSQ